MDTDIDAFDEGYVRLKKEELNDIGLENLRMAVVERAAKDYAAAVRKGLYHERHSLERFFKSGYFNLFCTLDGAALARDIRIAVQNGEPLFEKDMSHRNENTD